MTSRPVLALILLPGLLFNGCGGASSDPEREKDSGQDALDSGSEADAGATAVLACTEHTISTLHRSCQEIIAEDPTAADGVYALDPDGADQGVTAFCAYCLMSSHEGGWTLVANHADGIDRVDTPELVTPSKRGVLEAQRWRGLRDTVTTGMLFIDEHGNASLMAKKKLDAGSCVSFGDVDSLDEPNATWSAGKTVALFHNETAGCNATGGDYSIGIIAGKEYQGWQTAGAQLQQLSATKFDVWPYRDNVSWNEQDELLYYVK